MVCPEAGPVHTLKRGPLLRKRTRTVRRSSLPRQYPKTKPTTGRLSPWSCSIGRAILLSSASES